MYPIEYGRIIGYSVQTEDIKENVKWLSFFLKKLNEKLVFPDQIPTVIEVESELYVNEGIIF